MAADCKSAALRRYGGSNPSLPTNNSDIGSGPARGADPPGATSDRAHVAQLVEHVLGKDGVSSSNLLVGSRNLSRAPGPAREGEDEGSKGHRRE